MLKIKQRFTQYYYYYNYNYYYYYYFNYYYYNLNQQNNLKNNNILIQNENSPDADDFIGIFKRNQQIHPSVIMNSLFPHRKAFRRKDTDPSPSTTTTTTIADHLVFNSSTKKQFFTIS